MSGIYIHIPLCHSKCAYCDFYSTPTLKARADEQGLIDCILAEYDMRKQEIPVDINTIYIGGGTPSVLSIDSLKRLVGHLPKERVEEFTMEVNPEDVNADNVAEWRDMGINRISMGVQSLIDSELNAIGRRHNASTALEAAMTIKAKGINNLSLDLIYGLPDQTNETWRKSLEGLLELEPEHLSAYILSYEPHTRITAMLNTGKIKACDDDTIEEMYNMLCTITREHGYEHYEISNFAKPGYRAKHNSSYWNGTPYLGLGPAAHSYDGRSRRVNPSSIKQYLEKVSSGNTVYEIEKETRTDIFNDMLITRLRTSEGLDFAKVHVRRRLLLLTAAYPYIKREELIVNNNHLSIPERHWLISDAIMRDLIQ